MKYSTIFFDLDDTLWDTAANSRESLEEVFHLFSFDQHYPSFDDFYAIYLPHNLSLWDLYEQHQITKQELMEDRFYSPFRHIPTVTKEQGKEMNQEFMKRTASKSRTINGAKEILEVLKPYYKICVLSNGFEEVQDKKIKSADLDQYFDEVILSDHIGINKPDARLFQYALDKMKTNTEESIMVGDNWYSDIIGAKNSNIDQIWYNPEKKQAKDFIPTYTIKQLSEIKKILTKE